MTHILSDTLGQPLVAVVAGVGLGSTIGFLSNAAGLTDVGASNLVDPAISGAVYGGVIGAVPGITMGITKDILGEKYDSVEMSSAPAHAPAAPSSPSFLSRVFGGDAPAQAATPEPEGLSASEKREFAEYKDFQRWRKHAHTEVSSRAMSETPRESSAYDLSSMQRDVSLSSPDAHTSAAGSVTTMRAHDRNTARF
jgi:hypothetical protein